MKLSFLLTITLLSILTINAQVPADSMYFGFNPPEDSAIIFAPGFISIDNRYDQNGVFSPDGKEFCFTVTNSDWSNSELYYTKLEDSVWRTPKKADFVNGVIWDPFFSPDGSSLIYCDNNPTNIWKLEKDSNNWANPVLLDSPVNSSSYEWSPSLSMDGTIYYYSRRNENIFWAKMENGSYTQTEEVESPINSFSDKEPFIAADESFLLICSTDRPGRFGQDDIFISYRKNNRWTNPKNVGPQINSSEIEFSPNLTPDNKYLIFTRRVAWQTNTPTDIYWVNTSFIEDLKLTNYEPYILNKIPNQTDSVGYIYSYTIPDSIFIDDDGNETLTFSAVQKNGNDLPEWLNFDPATRTFSGTPTAQTYYNIKVTATDTAGAFVSTIFILTIKGTVGISDVGCSESLKLYPNPANDKIQIEYKGMSQSDLCQMVSVDGKVVYTGLLETGSINVSDINRGLYIMKLFIKDEVICRKIIIE